jgi:hypothetical protein
VARDSSLRGGQVSSGCQGTHALDEISAFSMAASSSQSRSRREIKVCDDEGGIAACGDAVVVEVLYRPRRLEYEPELTFCGRCTARQARLPRAPSRRITRCAHSRGTRW